jgi:tRNA pseudouridine55 synthase
MNGFLLVDKPKGITSFYCVKILRKTVGVRRIGFAGTLDPLATGLMIFALGEATKMIEYLEKSDKVYEAVIRLGAVSDTYDADGKIEEMSGFEKPERRKIEKILKNEFVGSREQTPPAFSAIHVDGKRAYDLARKGEKVELKKRAVQFFAISINSYNWPLINVTVHCGSGTYIRSFAHDLGKILGCGAYVEELRRIKIGAYKVEDAISIDDSNRKNILKKIVQPQDFFSDFDRLDLSDAELETLNHGGFVGRAADTGQPILAMHKGECVGVLEAFQGKLKYRNKFNMI